MARAHIVDGHRQRSANTCMGRHGGLQSAEMDDGFCMFPELHRRIGEHDPCAKRGLWIARTKPRHVTGLFAMSLACRHRP